MKYSNDLPLYYCCTYPGISFLFWSSLFLTMIVLGFAFRADDRWKNFAVYTWGTLALAGPAFFIKGAAFYVFLFAILVWNEIAAMRLHSHVEN